MFLAKKFSYSGFNTIVLRGICHFVETNINISTKLWYKHKQLLNQ